MRLWVFVALLVCARWTIIKTHSCIYWLHSALLIWMSHVWLLWVSHSDQDDTDTEARNSAAAPDHGPALYLPGHNKPFDPRAAADAQESMKAKVNVIRKKLTEQVSTGHAYVSVLSKTRHFSKVGHKVTIVVLNSNCSFYLFFISVKPKIV